MDKRIGAQLFTVRDYTQTLGDFDKTLGKIADIGYQAVQLSAIGPFSAAEIKPVLDKYHLIPVCTHRSMDEYENHLQASIAFHKEIGCSIAGLGSFPAIWKEFAWQDVVDFVKKMNEINAAFRENGMSFAYHNHHYEFLKFEQGYVMDYLIEHGDFDFILDVYWLSVAGIDPARFIKKLGSRAKVIHFKDMKLVRGENPHQMAEVMEGNLDWDSILEACEEAGCQWAMVEQDVCQRDPFESLKISYDNLKTKGFC